MNDELGTDPDVTAASAEAPASFGARLKWERERQGLSVGDVAGRLRLHPNQVRALEQEALAKLPEAAYVRGFLRSYARLLNVDPALLLTDLGQKLSPSADSVVDGMVQARDYSPVREAAREHASRRFVLAGAVLLLIVLGGLGWYATTQRTVQSVAAPVTAPPPSAPASTSAAEPPASAAAAAPPPPAEAAAAADTAALTAPVAPAPLLKLRFTGPSWVEVKDTEGKVLLSQHSAAGAEHVIEGTPPYYVVVGDAARVVVEVRGEPFDLAPLTRQNVARFTVN